MVSKTQLSYTFQFNPHVVINLTKELLKTQKDGIGRKEDYLNAVFHKISDKGDVKNKERMSGEYLRMLEILGIIDKITNDGKVFVNPQIVKFKDDIGSNHFWQYISNFMRKTRYIHRFGYEFLDKNKDQKNIRYNQKFNQIRAYVSKKIVDESVLDKNLDEQFRQLKIKKNMTKNEWMNKGVDSKAITCVIEMYKLTYQNEAPERNSQTVKKPMLEKEFVSILIEKYRQFKEPNSVNLTIKFLKDKILEEYELTEGEFDELLRKNYYDSRLHFESGKPYNVDRNDGLKIKKLGGGESTYYLISIRDS